MSFKGASFRRPESQHKLLTEREPFQNAKGTRFPSYIRILTYYCVIKVEGQMNLRDAARRTISYVNPDTGKYYSLAEGTKPAVLLVRPRGWHLDEAHVTVDGR